MKVIQSRCITNYIFWIVTQYFLHHLWDTSWYFYSIHFIWYLILRIIWTLFSYLQSLLFAIGFLLSDPYLNLLYDSSFLILVIWSLPAISCKNLFVRVVRFTLVFLNWTSYRGWCFWPPCTVSIVCDGCKLFSELSSHCVVNCIGVSDTTRSFTAPGMQPLCTMNHAWQQNMSDYHTPLIFIITLHF